MSQHILLRRLLKSDEQAFLAAYNAWETPDMAKRWFSCWKPSTSFDVFRSKIMNQHYGIGLEEGFVPSSTIYAFIEDCIGDAVVGRVSIRHKLTDALQIYGGHIGYAVVPKYRGKGYGSEILYRALGRCRYIGLKEILLTISKDNVASISVAKKCGAEFADEFYDENHKRITQRWTIKL